MRYYDTIGGEKKNIRLYVLLMIVLAAGVIAGSIYLVKNSAQMSGEIRGYIGDLFTSVAKNKNTVAVFKNSIISNLISVGIIFVMGFFRFGCAATGFILIRKGFITGFAAASFFKFYGIKGLLIMLSTMPTTLITIPALMFFSAVSIRFSFCREKRQKKALATYFFSLFLTVLAFCAASLCESFVTTTFMGWLSPKINS